MHKMIVPILVSLFLIACASNEGYDRVAAEKQKQKVIDAKNDRLKEVIEDLPDWAVNPPKSDQEGMYAVGMGNSDSFNTALKMATLEAEFGLAKLYSQELSGSERIYATGGEFEGVTSYQGLIDKMRVGRHPGKIRQIEHNVLFYICFYGSSGSNILMPKSSGGTSRSRSKL